MHWMDLYVVVLGIDYSWHYIFDKVIAKGEITKEEFDKIKDDLLK